MTDRKYFGLRHIAKVSEKKKMRTKRRGVTLTDSQSPSCQHTYNCCQDLTSPKRRARLRSDGCYSGDSPTETETQQDIIWDSSSPTQNYNGKVNGIEISELVNRIAPKVGRPKEGDSVLQWIGDNAITCTPEVRQPRVRKISARQSDVEDLRKLAKQFDINMTRQDKERQQNATEELNNLNKSKSATARTSRVTSGPSQARLEEEELQALFDGPTQHLSGRLSPPSVDCTPEFQPGPVAVSDPGTSLPAVRNAPVDAQKTTDMGFDDDWENDDILNDSFVLEMTQNPVPTTVVETQSIAQPNCSSVSFSIVAKTNDAASNVRGICQQVQNSTSKSSTFTWTPPEGQISVQCTSRLKPPASPFNDTTQKLLINSLIIQGKQPVSSSHGSKQTELDKATKDCKSAAQPTTSEFQGISDEDLKSLFDSDGLWNDEDDDLLCKACDDIERISDSQEQQRQSMSLTKPAKSTSKAPSSTDIIQASTRALVRSNSVPCSSSWFKENSGALATAECSSTGPGSYHYKQAQNEQAQGESSLGHLGSIRVTNHPQNIPQQCTNLSSNSHNSTFKRHLSDSVAITNKVFVSSGVKCTAAEIEKKKQEAIARRRLRLQARQKQGGPI